MNYTFVNPENTIVLKTDDDGIARVSFLFPAEGPYQQEYQKWLDEGNVTEPYVAPPEPVPQIISDRQFFQQAAILGIITNSDALAAVQTGTIPPELQTIVDNITDPTQKFSAQMILSGATVFERNHPLTIFVGTQMGLTEEEVDNFFRAAAQL